MTYTPEVGHVITFANTYDNTTIYHVNKLGVNRVEVTPLDIAAAGNDYAINIGLDTFREMGGTPLVLSDEEMTAMETIYASMVVESIDKLEMAMTFSAIFGEEVAQIVFPIEDLEAAATKLKDFGKGIEFLRTARANAASV